MLQLKEIKRTNLGIFDADFIPFIVCHNKRDTNKKSLQDCITECDNLISNILSNIKAEYYIGYLTKGKCFRYNVYPDYKSHRTYKDMPDYMQEVKQHLKDKYNFSSLEGYEADDLCLSARNKLKDQYNTILISTDKDLLNLEGMNYNFRKNELLYSSKQFEEYSFWISMVKGDSADFVKGIKGIGEKGAEKLLDGIGNIHYKNVVLDKYCEIYGERNGIREYYINYYCLKIVGNIQMDITLNKVNDNFSE